MAIAEAAPAIDARDRPRAAAATGAAALGEETMREEGVGAEEANDVDAAVTAVVVAPRAWCRRAAIVFYLLIARFVLVLCSRMLERLLSTLSAREMDGVRKEGEEKRERSKIAFFLFSFRASFLKIQATRCLSFFFFFFFEEVSQPQPLLLLFTRPRPRTASASAAATPPAPRPAASACRPAG